MDVPCRGQDAHMTETPGNRPDQNDERGGDAPNPDTGVGMGAGNASTFEPEEDPESTAESQS